MSRRTFDVAIIGAGVFGSWTAYQLQRSGKRVALIDAHGPANSRSSSGDESRILRIGYGADEIYARAAQHSLQLWKNFEAEAREPLFRQTGLLWLAHESDPYQVKSSEVLTRLGVSLEKFTIAEAREHFPQLNLSGIGWAMLEPDSGVLFARRGVQALVREAIKQGAEYFQDTAQAPPRNGSIDFISTENGQRVAADIYVFACGPWLPKIFPDLLAGRIHPTRQEVFYFRPPAGNRFTSPALPVWIDFNNEAYGLPDLESRGVKVAIDRHGAPFDPDTGDRVATAEGLKEARRYLARRLPELKDAPVIEARVCQYENTSNGDFLIDRHPEFSNVWIVGGGSGHGFKHGPFIGEYVAQRIDGVQEGIEPRFSLATKERRQNRAVY